MHTLWGSPGVGPVRLQVRQLWNQNRADVYEVPKQQDGMQEICVLEEECDGGRYGPTRG